MHCIHKWWFFAKWVRILCCSIINNNQRAIHFSNVWCFYRIEGIISWVRSNHTMISPTFFHRYSEKAILNRIDFVITYSTFDSLEVIESVCKTFDVENILRTLLCKINPLMMLNGKIKEPCQEIHDSLGKKDSVNVLLSMWSSKMSY